MTKKFLGIDCPGCGLQRSAAFLIQGDFAAAFEMYPAIYAILLLFGVLLLNNLVKIKYYNMVVNVLMILCAVLILGNYILKFTH